LSSNSDPTELSLYFSRVFAGFRCFFLALLTCSLAFVPEPAQSRHILVENGRVDRQVMVRAKCEENVMKDQLITLLEAIRVAQDMLEVERHMQETLAELSSVLCNEAVVNGDQAARGVLFP
jgi:hypothetical protein